MALILLQCCLTKILVSVTPRATAPELARPASCRGGVALFSPTPTLLCPLLPSSSSVDVILQSCKTRTQKIREARSLRSPHQQERGHFHPEVRLHLPLLLP